VLVLRGYRDPSRGHVAVVSGMVSDRILKVDQANWLNQGEISLAVPVLDVSPQNDWSQVRVWHIPSGQWGARIYEVGGKTWRGQVRGATIEGELEGGGAWRAQRAK
jgi:hypothetical protein